MSVSIGGKIKTNEYLDKTELKRISSRKSIVMVPKNPINNLNKPK